MASAVQYPQTFIRHRPVAAIAQAALTVSMSSVPQAPSPPSCTPAAGFNRHSEASALRGKSSISAARALIVVPKTKKKLNAVTPAGRVLIAGLNVMGSKIVARGFGIQPALAAGVCGHYARTMEGPLLLTET